VLFQKQGYEHTTLADILARSGGSKATLRKYFGNKAGLFAAVVTAATERFVQTLDEPDSLAPPACALLEIGVAILKFYLQPQALAAYRGVVGSGYHEHAMARAFYEKGHALVRERVATRLRLWHTMGLLTSADSDRDADCLLHLLRAGVYEQSLIGLRQSTSNASINATVRRAVEIFLHGVAPSDPA